MQNKAYIRVHFLITVYLSFLHCRKNAFPNMLQCRLFKDTIHGFAA